MMGLIEALCDRLADVLEKVGHDIDGVSHAVFAGSRQEAPVNAQDLQTIIVKVWRRLLPRLQGCLIMCHPCCSCSSRNGSFSP